MQNAEKEINIGHFHTSLNLLCLQPSAVHAGLSRPTPVVSPKSRTAASYSAFRSPSSTSIPAQRTATLQPYSGGAAAMQPASTEFYSPSSTEEPAQSTATRQLYSGGAAAMQPTSTAERSFPASTAAPPPRSRRLGPSPASHAERPTRSATLRSSPASPAEHPMRSATRPSVSTVL